MKLFISALSALLMRHLGICIRSKLKLENVAKDILRLRDFFLNSIKNIRNQI